MTTALRESLEGSSATLMSHSPLVALRAEENGWAATCARKDGTESHVRASTVVLAQAGAATARRRTAASFRPTIPAPPAR